MIQISQEQQAGGDRWVQASKEKLKIIQDGIEGLLGYCKEAGLDEDFKRVLLEPYYSMLQDILVNELPLSRMLDSSEYVLKLDGTGVDGYEPRVKLLADYLTKGRSGYAKVAREVSKERQLHFATLPRSMDLSFAGQAPGSLYLGFNLIDDSAEMDGQGKLEIAHEQYIASARTALAALGDGVSAVASGKSLSEFSALFESEDIRNAVLRALHDLAPSGYEGEHGTVSSIKIMGCGLNLDKFETLTPDIRKVLGQWMEDLELPDEHHSLIGNVREIDLDKRRFELRDIDGMSKSVRCIYPDELNDVAAEWVGHRVNAVGDAHFDESGEIKSMTIMRVAILDADNY